MFVRGLSREVPARCVRVHTVTTCPVRIEWLARGHGAPPVSADYARGRFPPGVHPDRVADQVAGCLTSRWSRTVAVPRWMGLARLGEVPPVDRVLDLVLSRQADRIRRVAARMVAERTG